MNVRFGFALNFASLTRQSLRKYVVCDKLDMSRPSLCALGEERTRTAPRPAQEDISRRIRNSVRSQDNRILIEYIWIGVQRLIQK